MNRLQTRLDPRSAEYRDNAAQMSALVDDLRARLAAAARAGDDKSRDRHTARGKLLARDRVETLLDPGSPFLELAPLAAHGLYGDDAPCAAPASSLFWWTRKPTLRYPDAPTIFPPPPSRIMI